MLHRKKVCFVSRVESPSGKKVEQLLELDMPRFFYRELILIAENHDLSNCFKIMRINFKI